MTIFLLLGSNIYIFSCSQGFSLRDIGLLHRVEYCKDVKGLKRQYTVARIVNVARTFAFHSTICKKFFLIIFSENSLLVSNLFSGDVEIWSLKISPPCPPRVAAVSKLPEHVSRGWNVYFSKFLLKSIVLSDFH